jgi:host factor-I protein
MAGVRRRHISLHLSFGLVGLLHAGRSWSHLSRERRRGEQDQEEQSGYKGFHVDLLQRGKSCRSLYPQSADILLDLDLARRQKPREICFLKMLKPEPSGRLPIVLVRYSFQCCVYNICMPFRAQGNANAAKRGRTPPPEETFEEASFLKALGEKQRPVSVKLMDGQTVSGWIEYYDKHMVRLTREGAPNLFIF